MLTCLYKTLLSPGFLDQLDSDCELNYIEVSNYLYVTCNFITFCDIDYIVINEPTAAGESDQLDCAKIIPKNAVKSWTPYNKGYYAKESSSCGIIYCEEQEADIKHVGIGVFM